MYGSKTMRPLWNCGSSSAWASSPEMPSLWRNRLISHCFYSIARLIPKPLLLISIDVSLSRQCDRFWSTQPQWRYQMFPARDTVYLSWPVQEWCSLRHHLWGALFFECSISSALMSPGFRASLASAPEPLFAQARPFRKEKSKIFCQSAINAQSRWRCFHRLSPGISRQSITGFQSTISLLWISVSCFSFQLTAPVNIQACQSYYVPRLFERLGERFHEERKLRRVGSRLWNVSADFPQLGCLAAVLARRNEICCVQNVMPNS